MAAFTVGNPNRFWNKPIPFTPNIPGVGVVGNGLKKAAKVGGIAALAVGGIAALGIMANRSRSHAARDARDEIANAPDAMDMQSQMMPQIPQMMPPQPLETGPAEGRAPGEWVNRVAADRGGLAPQNPAAQPKMDVVPESKVQDLGASAPSQPVR